MSIDRLFVALAKDPYVWFASGAKTWEVRQAKRGFSPQHVRVGRQVELRLGYSSPNSIWGRIVQVEVASGLAELFSQVPYENVTPLAASLDEALAVVAAILRLNPDEPASLIAFRVEVDERPLP